MMWTFAAVCIALAVCVFCLGAMVEDRDYWKRRATKAEWQALLDRHEPPFRMSRPDDAA